MIKKIKFGLCQNCSTVHAYKIENREKVILKLNEKEFMKECLKIKEPEERKWVFGFS